MGASASTMYTQGGSWGLKFVPTYDLMEQVHVCLVPSDRDFLLACLEEMHRRCDSIINGGVEKQAAAFHEQGAIEALLEMLGMFKPDEVFLRQAIRSLVALCGYDDTILYHFLELGGREILDEVLETHEDNPYVQEDGEILVSIIQRYARGMAKRDAVRISRACRYCRTCRPLVDCPDLLGPTANHTSSDPDHARRCFRPGVGKRLVYRGANAGAKDKGRSDENNDEPMDPVSDDLARIQTLLEHMDKFPKMLDVVEPCVDALIAVGKSAATEAVLESKCVFRLIKGMKAFPKVRSLQWKGLLAIIHFAKKDGVCFDIGKAGAVQLLVKMWPQWEDDEMRQLMLWAMNEVSRIETNQLRMSAERAGAVLREIMEPSSGRLPSAGAMVTAERAGHYLIPIKLKRLYRQRKLGNPFAKVDEDAKRDNQNETQAVLSLTKPQFGTAGEDWGKGEEGLI